MTGCSNSKLETSISKVLSIIVLVCDHSRSERNLDIMIKVYGQTSFSLSRSLNYTKRVVQEYMYSKRQGPQLPFKRIINEVKDLLFADQFISNLAWLLSWWSVPALHIPSCAGYHIKLWSGVPVKKNFVGYLDCLDAPTTEISTVFVPIFTRFTFVLFSFHEKQLNFELWFDLVRVMDSTHLDKV